MLNNGTTRGKSSGQTKFTVRSVSETMTMSMRSTIECTHKPDTTMGRLTLRKTGSLDKEWMCKNESINPTGDSDADSISFRAFVRRSFGSFDHLSCLIS
jgi:hypothetical protein